MTTRTESSNQWTTNPGFLPFLTSQLEPSTSNMMAEPCWPAQGMSLQLQFAFCRWPWGQVVHWNASLFLTCGCSPRSWRPNNWRFLVDYGPRMLDIRSETKISIVKPSYGHTDSMGTFVAAKLSCRGGTYLLHWLYIPLCKPTWQVKITISLGNPWEISCKWWNFHC